MTQNGLYDLTHNVDTEHKVLAACLANIDLYEDVKDRLSLDMFTDLDSRKVYDIVCQLTKEGKAPEMTEVGMRLVRMGGNMSSFLTDIMPSFTIVMQQIDLLKEMAIRRNVMALCYKGQAIANDPTQGIESMEVLIKDLESAVRGQACEDVQTFGEVTQDLLGDITKLIEGKAEKGMMTGLHVFDSRYGFHGGDLVILAGETSQGKTTLATTIAYNVAVEKFPVAFYSMEMTAKQLTARIMAGCTLVPSSKSLFEKLTPEEYNRFYDTTLAIRNLPIYFDERSKTTFSGICRSIRKMVKMFRVRMIFIDYLQILANGGRLDSREQIIGDMARDLKRLAVELDVCIIALSQMSRQTGREKNVNPTISRLRGSGQIEEAADIVVLVWSDDQKNETTNVAIAKGRNIGLATERVRFDRRLSRFMDYQQGDADAPYQEKASPLPF